jgi:hypothetical protein
VEIDRVLFDMSFDRDEILIDEAGDFIVGVGLGFQPSARASSRCGAEIQQQRFVRRLGFRQCRINILLPIYSHDFSSLKLYSRL